MLAEQVNTISQQEKLLVHLLVPAFFYITKTTLLQIVVWPI